MTYILSKNINWNEVEWDKNGYCWMENIFGGQIHVLNKNNAILSQIQEYLNDGLRNVNEVLNGNYHLKSSRMLNPIDRSEYGKKPFIVRSLIKKFVLRYIYLFSKIIIYREIDENTFDGLFLFNIGVKRNFKSGCAICLTDKIMGTTCSCGHTEVVCFRPCGHTLCANPCFSEMIKNMNIPYLETTINIENKKFIVVGKQDLSNGIDIKCPLCRSVITKTFRIEDTKIHFSDIGIGHNEINELKKEIDLSFY